MHRIRELYQTLYRLGQKVPKRDRFGIHAQIERACLEALTLAVHAALETRIRKVALANELRIKIEVLKHLIRTANEIGVIEKKVYIALTYNLQEISRMTSGWLKYLQNKEGSC